MLKILVALCMLSPSLSAQVQKFVVPDRATLRATPSAAAESLGAVQPGTRLTIDWAKQSNPSWVRLRVDGKLGYISLDELEDEDLYNYRESQLPVVSAPGQAEPERAIPEPSDQHSGGYTYSPPSSRSTSSHSGGSTYGSSSSHTSYSGSNQLSYRSKKRRRQSGSPTAICRDGTYSYSKNRRGTCSHHGGVAQWL